MLKYTKGLEIGVTFFAVWVVLVPNSYHIKFDQSTSYYYADLSLNPNYDVGLQYFITKESCDLAIKATRSLAKKYSHVPYPLYKENLSTQLGNGVCVKASDL